MDKQTVEVRWLVAVALVLCALIIGYNVFYVPDASIPQVQTDISSSSNAESDLESTAEPESENASSGTSQSVVTGKININTATAEELDELPGVGPAIAAKIIAYRESNGNFRSPEEIMNVSGIGEKTFAKMKDMITV